MTNTTNIRTALVTLGRLGGAALLAAGALATTGATAQAAAVDCVDYAVARGADPDVAHAACDPEVVQMCEHIFSYTYPGQPWTTTACKLVEN